jgi:hypothetical protein
MAGKKSQLPRTPKKRLSELPQFEPDYSYHHIEFEDGERIIFTPERGAEIKTALAQFIRPHARSVNWDGKLTGIDRFVENAMRAIATFEYRRSKTRRFDRQLAKATLRTTVGKIIDASRALEEIASNPELAYFLQELFVALMAEDRPTDPSQKLSARALRSAIRRSSQQLELYKQEFSPHMMAAQLMRLEPILSLAAEKVELQPGDFQRDEIAQELCNDLARAWISGTGQLPTFSKPNPRLRSKSAFAELLSLVNNSILDAPYRHENNFRTYGDKARDLMRKGFRDLAVSHQPRRRR